MRRPKGRTAENFTTFLISGDRENAISQFHCPIVISIRNSAGSRIVLWQDYDALAASCKLDADVDLGTERYLHVLLMQHMDLASCKADA